MEQELESAFVGPGDNAALVCIGHQQYQEIVAPQLIDLGYKLHLGVLEEDVILKLQSNSYDVIAIYENFRESTLQTNPILRQIAKEPGARRREHFVVLLSHRSATNDGMSAFVQSVDQIINIADLANFKTLVQREITTHRQLYHSFNQTLQSVQSL